MRDFKNKLIELINKHQLSSFKEKILSISEDAILMRKTEEEDYTEIGNSRFCGYPDLPENISWPKITEAEDEFEKENIGLPKLFAAQINLEEIPNIGKLPEKGMLYFFIGCNCISGYGKVDSEIIYYPNKLVKIQDLKNKVDATYCTYDEPTAKYHLNNSYKIEFEKALTIPETNSEIFEAINLSEDDENKYNDLYWEYYEFLREGYDGRDLLNMMFGFVYCGGENLRKDIASYKEIGKEKDWEVIFSLQSDVDTQLNFNDFGCFNFLLQKMI